MDIKISRNWLLDQAKLDLSDSEIEDRLTSAGLTVDRIVPLEAPFSGVISGSIVDLKAVPLFIVEISTGLHNVLALTSCSKIEVGTNLLVEQVPSLPSWVEVPFEATKEILFGKLVSGEDSGLDASSASPVRFSSDYCGPLKKFKAALQASFFCDAIEGSPFKKIANQARLESTFSCKVIRTQAYTGYSPLAEATVNDGSRESTVICGAPDIKAGSRYAFAPPALQSQTTLKFVKKAFLIAIVKECFVLERSLVLVHSPNLCFG